MTDNLHTPAPDDTPVDDYSIDVPSAGQQIRAARAAAGLSTEQLAQQLRLTSYYIEALENDDFERLPAEPFVLGYYRACARLLNLPPEQLIEAYRQRCSAQVATEETLVSGPLERGEVLGKTSFWGNRLYIIVALVLIAIWVLVSVLWTQEPQPQSSAPVAATESQLESRPRTPAAETASDTDGAVESLPQPLAAEVGAEAGASEAGSADLSRPDADAISAADTDATDPAVATVDVATVDNAGVEAIPLAEPVARDSSASRDRLQLRFNGECWLEVADANGDVLAANLYQAGDTVELQGLAPFDVMLGNARAASVTLNGEPQALTPDPGRKTLRTQVGE